MYICVYIYEFCSRKSSSALLVHEQQASQKLKDIILNVCNFQQQLLFAHRNYQKYNSGTKISAVTRQTVHGNIVAVESYVHLIYHFSTFRRFQHCLCSHIYFSCSHHKQLNGFLEGMAFVMLVAHEEIALISSSWSETCLLLYVHEQLAMLVHLFVFHYYICGYYDVQTTCICIYET